MQFWQNCRKFFFRTKIFFRSNTELNETWQSFEKKSRSSLDTENAVSATQLKLFARGLDDYRLKSENMFEKVEKKITFLNVLLWTLKL